MSSGLRVLTMNTQLRSYGMEALAQGNPDPHTSTEERAVIISKRILQSPQDYDVICLNEVFDEDARPIFEDLLLPKYPNAVMKADLLKLDVRQNTPSPFDVLPLPPAPWSLGIGFDPVKIFELLAGKLEDSGLMLFSRLPFAQAIPVPGDLVDLLASLGLGQPPGVPIVLFIPYPDSDFDDSLASKGVIYARLRSPDEGIVHLLMSHTQADATGKIMEHQGTRDSQFDLVWDILTTMVGSPPFEEEVIFCGDFNVNGLALGGVKANEEAIARFGDPQSVWREHMRDAWWWEQCAGVPSSANRMPADCDPGMTAPGQRLDYFLRAAPFPGRRVTQHIAVAWDIAQAQPGQGRRSTRATTCRCESTSTRAAPGPAPTPPRD